MKPPSTLVLLAATALGSGCGSPAPPPPLETSAFRGSGGGFSVMTHGFSFPNYGNDGVRANLTSDEVERMFGDRVCAARVDGACLLTPPAEEFLKRMNRTMAVGHCEGMAVLAALFLVGRADPTNFGAATANALQIDNNPALQGEIAYWWALQTVAPTSKSRRAIAPAQLVSTLRASFLPGSNQAYTLAVFKPNLSGGHALNPIAIREVSPTRADIVVYDNNLPNVERVIEVDTAANTWRFQASTDPSQTESAYEGSATTRSLFVVPLGARLQTATCDFCGDYPGLGPRPLITSTAAPTPTTEPDRELSLSGLGDLQIRDGMNRLLGSGADGVVNDIPGADFFPIVSVDPWRENPEPFYEVPAGTHLTVTVDGTRLSAMSPSEFSLTGRGYSLAVHNILLDPGQRDTIEVAPVGAGVRYTTTQSESADVVIGVQTSGADYLFTVRTHGGAGGESIEAELDPARGVLWFGFDGTAGAMNSFDLEVDRITARGHETFRHMASIEPAGADLLLHYASWGGDGTPMELGVDSNADGTEDSTSPISDQ